MKFYLNMDNITLKLDILKMFFIGIATYYTYLKIINIKNKTYIHQIVDVIGVILISILAVYIRYKVDLVVSKVFFILGISLCNLNMLSNNLGHTILAMTISLSINYIIYSIAIVFAFFVNIIYSIQSDYFNFAIMMFVHIILLFCMSKIKRFHNGIIFFNRNIKNDYLDMIILNISIVVSFSFIIFANTDKNSIIPRRLLIIFSIFIVVMFITIQKSIQLYYKQKLIIQELTETKSELEKSKEEIKTLEKENIELSKKNHSFNHKYKSLKHKLDEILIRNEIAEEFDLKSQMDSLSKEIYVAPKNIELTKTGIPEIDDMLRFMKSECDEHKITFNLQILGNIYYMINNLIPKEELEILIADHIKDAIIAINHSDNVNKSILVKLGKMEDCYGLYIYDSGIEFEKETLENLGKKPITTHINEGGSGMGFMNTFDTLKKHNVSLIIEEIGKPCKENFTKIIKFKFDGQNEFKIC